MTHSPDSPLPPDTFVSVIICSHDRAPLLERAVLALAAQSLPSTRFEILVVDDGSRDSTPDLLRSLAARLPNLRFVILPSNAGTALARNAGLQSTSGQYVLFTDDDCIPDKHWVERMRDALDREPLLAGAVDSPRRPFLKLCHNVAQFYAFMPGRKPGPIGFIAGANMGFHRSVLEQLQGFRRANPHAEDMEFILRARREGFRPFFVPDAVVTHDPDRTSLASLFRYSARHAASTIRLRQEYASVLHTPFFLRSPFWLVLASPFLALAVTARIYLRSWTAFKLLPTAPVVFPLKLAWCVGAARELRQPPRVSA